MFVWPWLLGGGAAAAAAAYIYTQKKKDAPPVLPPYVGPVQPTPPAPPVYRPPAPYIPPNDVRPQILPMPPTPYVPPPPPPPPPPPTPPSIPQIFPSWENPFLTPGTLKTTPTVYEAKQGQPGPSGTPYSYTTMQVTTASGPLNLRSSPNGTVIGAMPKGSNFLVAKIEGGWAFGKSAALGKEGWASMQYLGGPGAMTESFSSTPYGQATESFSAGVSGAAKGSVYVEGFRTLIRQTMKAR